MSVLETDMLNGRDVSDRNGQRADEEREPDRDPSRLPVTNLEAYKSWCQRVRDDWDDESQ